MTYVRALISGDLLSLIAYLSEAGPRSSECFAVNLAQCLVEN